MKRTITVLKNAKSSWNLNRIVEIESWCHLTIFEWFLLFAIDYIKSIWRNFIRLFTFSSKLIFLCKCGLFTWKNGWFYRNPFYSNPVSISFVPFKISRLFKWDMSILIYTVFSFGFRHKMFKVGKNLFFH